jgi:signal transduction histidine kinase/CHASE3 domain sensor protein/DNA-binding NarL/FixJ family response regulator
VRGGITRNLAHASFWLAVLVIVIMGWTLYEASTNEAESARRVAHSQNVRQRLVGIEASIERAEFVQRGYLLSAIEVFPLERDQAFAKLHKAVASVHKLTRDAPRQQQRLSELETLIEARHGAMRENERVRREGMSAVQIEVAAAAGRAHRARLLDLTKALKQEERNSLRAHRTAAAHRHETELGALIAAAVFGLIVLIPGYLGFVLQSRARQQSEKRLKIMADSLPGAMYQLRHCERRPPRLLFMSAAVGSISKRESPDWSSLLADIDAGERRGFELALAACRQSLAPFSWSYRVTHADGTTQFLHHAASLQRQADGSILQNGYIADVSEQRRLEDALVAAKEAADEANRAKSAFLATMSHEIRTPMNGALGMLELLGLTALDVEQRATLSIVRESSTSLLRLIDDILDFSMIEADKLELRPDVVSIRDVIEGVRNIYSGIASSKGLSILRRTDPRISPALRVDPLRLRQILNNLVSNALKFTREGHVEIQAEWLARVEGADRVRFSVSDTGIGISPENQRRLFQPFSQGDGKETRHVGGTGLGLAICRRLAGLMGGTVAMTSEPGVGTTMVLELSLPIAPASALPRIDTDQAQQRLIGISRSRRDAPGVEQATAEGTLVLIVDDHPTNRMLLMRQVHTLGYAALSAENGVEALARWRSGRFGLLVTDCNMPEMDGYELTVAIRASERERGAARVPIISCTASALDGQREKCLAAGMDDCLVKPVDLAQMLRTLDRWLPLPGSARTPGSPALPDHAASRPTSTDEDVAVLDRAVLAEGAGGDAEVERSILAAFRHANDADTQALDRAVIELDLAKVARTAHGMSGAARVIGARSFARVCERIEEAGRAGEWSPIHVDMTTLHRERHRLNTQLESI